MWKYISKSNKIRRNLIFFSFKKIYIFNWIFETPWQGKSQDTAYRGIYGYTKGESGGNILGGREDSPLGRIKIFQNILYFLFFKKKN